MTDIPLEQKPRDRFLEAVRKELAAFERREREFRKMDRKERAAQMNLPVEFSGKLLVVRAGPRQRGPGISASLTWPRKVSTDR